MTNFPDNYHPSQNPFERELTPEEQAETAKEERRERVETALREFLAKQMRVERVGCFGEPDLDDFEDEILTLVKDTNVISEAYEQIIDERKAALAAE